MSPSASSELHFVPTTFRLTYSGPPYAIQPQRFAGWFEFIGLLVSKEERKDDGRIVFAAMTQDRKYLTLAVANATEIEHSFDSNVSGLG